MIFKIIYEIGKKLRNPSLKSIYSFLKESEKFDLTKLENYQLKKVNEIIEFAKEYSPFYKEKLKDVVLPLQSLSDLESIPILTKKELLKNTKHIQSKYKFKKNFKAVTSGTTGNSLQFIRDEHADSFNRASIQRGYSWYEVSPWELNGYFWGFSFTFIKKIKTKFLDLLQNRFRIFGYKPKEFNRFINKLKNACYIHGYSSMIYQTARFINERGLPKPKSLKMIKGTSEKIFDHYQKEIIQAFGKKMISEYGATETGIIAFECPNDTIHVNMEGVIVEEIQGKIVVTNLQMKSFPIIRYELGDYIKLNINDEKCSCGLSHKSIIEITGRIGENIQGKTMVFPSFTFYYIFKNLDKEYGISLNYRVIQKEKGKLKFYIESILASEEKKILENEIIKYFKEEIQFSIIENSNVFNINKKQTHFVSYLNNE